MKTNLLKKHWGAGLCVLLAACGGAQYIAETWNAPIEVVPEPASIFFDKTAMREDADGNLRITYRSNNTTLAVDTYDNSGQSLVRQTFEDVPAEYLLNLFEASFLDDNTVYWVSQKYHDSRRLDLARGTAHAFPDIQDFPIAAGNEFVMQGHVLLENGRLVMVGQDHPEDSFAPLQNRIVILNPDGSHESIVAPLNPTWGKPLAKSGDQYYVRQSDDLIAVRDGLNFVEHIALDTSPLSIPLSIFADGQGIWYVLVDKLHHKGDTEETTWALEGINNVFSVTPLETDTYAVLHYNLPANAYAVSKITLGGTIVWTTDVGLKNFPRVRTLDYRNGRILVSQDTDYIKQSFMVDDTQAPPKTILTGKRTGAVAHMQLDLNGKIIARYREPDYKALLLRDMDQPRVPEYTEVLEYTAGSCGLLDTIQLSNGNLASLSDWCTDQIDEDASAQVHYFTAP